MDWTYGDAGDRIPVQAGEVWAVGPHRMMCGDLEADGANIKRFLSDAAGALVYVDPPWNDGNARSFRTKSGRDGEKGRPTSIVALLTSLFGIAKELRPQAVFCETGDKELEMVKRLMEAEFISVPKSYPIVYYRTHPCQLVQCGGPLIMDFVGKDDDFTPGIAMDAMKPKMVIDLCAGRGGTLVSAASRGIPARGVELAPRRMAVALDKLSKMTNHQPERVE